MSIQSYARTLVYAGTLPFWFMLLVSTAVNQLTRSV